jgi:hypothetical protein
MIWQIFSHFLDSLNVLQISFNKQDKNHPIKVLFFYLKFFHFIPDVCSSSTVCFSLFISLVVRSTNSHGRLVLTDVIRRISFAMFGIACHSLWRRMEGFLIRRIVGLVQVRIPDTIKQASDNRTAGAINARISRNYY